jgi:hypothetical protein
MKFCCLFLLSLFPFLPSAEAQLFSDNFTRGTDPGPLTPWLTNSGAWAVTGGTMQSGPNGTFNYADAYIANNFTNFTLQARLKFPAGAFGGGLGARVNTNNGAHYAAWVYPENSAGGSNVLRLIKFQTWSSFGYNGSSFTPIASTNLAAVGTGFHTVRMDLQTNQINVYFDGVRMINTTDVEAQPYTSGAISLDMWTDSAGYTFTVDDVVVNGLNLLATADSYNAVSGLALTVPAPGVLGNDSGGNGALNASLVSGTPHGILNLSSNGGFTYTATNGYNGSDSFTYRANDGQTNSSAVVTITVGADHAPVANTDTYNAQLNTPLSVIAPGVLANDTDVDGNNLTAALVSSPTNGTLTFTNNGGFTYTPNNGFLGLDAFTYRANDGLSNSAPATVRISVQPPALFSDDFSRGSDPGPLTPWQVQSGNWLVTAGVLRGTNNLFNYGFTYITSSWTNYYVQARMQFPSNSFGGGLGGRLNPATGAHYGAWIYPENSAGGPPGGSAVLKLIKFQDFGNFAYNGTNGIPITQVNLSSVGTNFHTVKLAFLFNQIAVYFDGTLVISVADTDPQPYLSGSVILDQWTDASAYVMTVDDVLVNPLAMNENYSVGAGATLSVPLPGVLANDTEVFGSNLTASVVSGPSHGTLTLTNSGGFTYSPSNGYYGSDSFLYQANDGVTNVGTATVTISVLNNPPVLSNQSNRTIAELTTLTVTNAATDIDLPAQTVTYQLLSPPAGATISAEGVISWTPSEAQGPGSYTLRTVATDDGSPPASATNSFLVTVTEVNTAPVLPVQTNRTVNELVLMTVVNTASDTDAPPNTLTYSFLASPPGAAISGSGVITWTPSEAQGPGIYTFTTRVVDNGVNPSALSDTNTFTVTVNDVNSAPFFLLTPPNRTIAAQTPLTVTNAANDSDIPVNTLTYSLAIAPEGASISTTGVITWTPSPAQDQSSNLFRTVVLDNGSPQPLGATNNFTVFVNSNPVVVLDSSALVLEGCTPTNNAIDPGETVTMTFAFKNVGTGPTTNLMVTLLQTNGVFSPSGPVSYGVIAAGGAAVSQPFTFSASGACGGSITAVFQVQDGSLSFAPTNLTFNLGAIISVSTQNFDTVTSPALPPNWTTSASGAEVNWRTTNSLSDTFPNAAFSPDTGNTGINELVSAPVTLPLTPVVLSFRHRYDLESSSVNPTLAYDGGVLEIKIGTNDFLDITNAGGTFVSGGYTRVISPAFDSPLSNRPAWSGTLTSYTNAVVNLPAAAAGQTIQLRWRCGTDNGGPTGAGWRIDSIGISGPVCCQNTAPMLAGQSDVAIPELTLMTVTNTASDSSTPPSGLSYTLVNPPAGAAIDTNGVINWTPTELQGPGVYSLTTIVTDNAFPPLSATNTFAVSVNEINTAPQLPFPTNRTITGLTTLIVTNTAQDSDVPTNTLTYLLVAGPPSATIDTNGIISWTTAPGDVPSTNGFTTVVTDNNPQAVNGQQLSATNTFTVTVIPANTPPVLTVPPDQTVYPQTTLAVSASATDSDVPTNTLTFSLLSAPLGMTIDTNSGAITWTPSQAQASTTNLITVVVTDNGSPNLSDTNTFKVVVRASEIVPAPVIQEISCSAGFAILSWTSVSNHIYRLQFKSDFADTNWTDIAPDITSTAATTTATNACGPAIQRFYRVLLLP